MRTTAPNSPDRSAIRGWLTILLPIAAGGIIAVIAALIMKYVR
jgi:hypothetical protein